MKTMFSAENMILDGLRIRVQEKRASPTSRRISKEEIERARKREEKRVESKIE
jgi:hypothetical protein